MTCNQADRYKPRTKTFVIQPAGHVACMACTTGFRLVYHQEADRTCRAMYSKAAAHECQAGLLQQRVMLFLCDRPRS